MQAVSPNTQRCSQQHNTAPATAIVVPKQVAASSSSRQTPVQAVPLIEQQNGIQQSVQEPIAASSLTDANKQQLLQQYTATQERKRQSVSNVTPLADLPHCQDGLIVRSEVGRLCMYILLGIVVWLENSWPCHNQLHQQRRDRAGAVQDNAPYNLPSICPQNTEQSNPKSSAWFSASSSYCHTVVGTSDLCLLTFCCITAVKSRHVCRHSASYA